MKVRYKKNTLIHSKGATLQQVKDCIKKRMEKREAELKKREWIYKEYLSLKSKQAEDSEWLAWLNTQSEESWGVGNDKS